MDVEGGGAGGFGEEGLFRLLSAGKPRGLGENRLHPPYLSHFTCGKATRPWKGFGDRWVHNFRSEF